MVQCSSNLCEGAWFHKSCVQLAVAPGADEDWFCSTECQEDGSYVYCVCKKRRGGQMFQCALMDNCKRSEWYHEECLTTSEKAKAKQRKNVNQ